VKKFFGKAFCLLSVFVVVAATSVAFAGCYRTLNKNDKASIEKKFGVYPSGSEILVFACEGFAEFDYFGVVRLPENATDYIDQMCLSLDKGPEPTVEQRFANEVVNMRVSAEYKKPDWMQEYFFTPRMKGTVYEDGVVIGNGYVIEKGFTSWDYLTSWKVYFPRTRLLIMMAREMP
jgi:hypothetical protein